MARVVTVTINRPKVRNALDTATWRKLLAAVQRLARSKCRVMIVRGSGTQAFSAGADLSELARIHRREIDSRRYVELMERVLGSIERAPQVVVAMMDGAAIGAGAELAIACDIRIASHRAVMGIPAARLGLAITMRDLARLNGLIGPSRTKSLVLTGRTVAAETALAWGLVDEVCQARDLEGVTSALADQIALNSPSSIRLMKQSLLRTKGRQTAESTWQSVRSAWRSSDLREGFAALAAGRQPEFSGT